MGALLALLKGKKKYIYIFLLTLSTFKIGSILLTQVRNAALVTVGAMLHRSLELTHFV